MITAADRHLHAPRIGINAFSDLLRAAGSPVADPEACYTQVFSRAVDPLFALAIFWRESNFATNPQSVNVRYGNRNPGNLRNPPPAAPTIPTDRGPFLTFPDWTSGFAGMAAHLASPLYANLSIGQVFAKWAPAADGNDPDAYTAGVLAYMNAHADSGAHAEGGTVADPWDRIHLSADQGPDRPVAAVRWFVVHDTEGSFPGDESVLTSAAPPVESVHFLVGRVPGQCVYSVPITATAWTAGNDQVSAQAVQVELSKNTAAGETDYTDYQYAKLAAIFRWCQSQGMTVPAVYIGRVDADGGPEPDAAGIIGHQDVPDPNHPGEWGGVAHHTDPGPTFDWPRLTSLIQHGTTQPPPPVDTRPFPETGKGISGLFKGFYEQFPDDKALEIFGLPVTDAVREAAFTVQYFERAVFEDHGGYVQLRRIGAAAALAAGHEGPGIP